MIVVHVGEVGGGAMARMARDSIVLPLAHGCAAGSDVPVSASLRALSLAQCVPNGAVLSGLAALWVWGFGADAPAPPSIDVAVPRGSHPDAPPACWVHSWSYVTDAAAVRGAIRVGGVGVARGASAAALALARDPWGKGLTAARWACGALGVADGELLEALSRQAPTQARTKAISTWLAVVSALGTDTLAVN